MSEGVNGDGRFAYARMRLASQDELYSARLDRLAKAEPWPEDDERPCGARWNR